jgi:general secretion pathway protein J
MTLKLHSRNCPRGFTLVELLVALFITAILFAMGYGAINQVLANRGAIEEQQARLLALQTTMRIFAQDFGQAAPRPVREPIGDTWQSAFRGEVAALGQTQSGQALISLTRAGWANPAGIQRSTLQRVSYVFENGVLRREHWPVLDTTLANKTTRRELLSRVRSIALRYMDGSRQWVERWPIQGAQLQNVSPPQPDASQRQRPLAVEVTLELEDYGRIVRIFEIPQ